MKKNVVLVLVLMALVAVSAFAQREGDTVQLSGQDYRVSQVNGNRVVLDKIEKLEGIYDRTVGGNNITAVNFSGDRAVIADFSNERNPRSLWSNAREKNLIRMGDPYLRNIKSTGATSWSCEVLELGDRGIIWERGTINLQANGDLVIGIQRDRSWRVEFRERPDNNRRNRR